MAILVSAIALVPTMIRQKFSRWQGALLLAIYAAYLVVVTVGLTPYLALFGVAA